MSFIKQVSPLLYVLAAHLPAHAEEGAVLPSLPALLLDRHQLVTVDGKLDEAAWQAAPEFAQFHQFLPENGKPVPPGLRTSVRLLIDEHALVFGIRAWDDDAAGMRGSLARRDKVARDQDFIGIWLDPTGHSRAAQFVRVNIDGVLSDGMYRADEDEQDMGPDFPIDAAVRRLPDGYSMEIRWPLANLRFPYEGGNAWKLMVERSVPHAGGLVLTSTPLRTGTISFIDALQPIDGMGATVETVRDRAFLDLKPELTVRANRDRDDAGRRHANEASASLEINARPRADWVFNATINPDFSQVEIDEPMPTGASRIALSLPEKRAFFLESADVLGLPLPAFYSRTIASPEWGLRATWRSAQADATAMSLRDEEGGAVQRGRVYETVEYGQTRRTLASLVRGRWHDGGMVLGAFASQRGYGDAGGNAVAGFDGQWRSDGNQASWLLMHSQTSAAFTDEERTVRVPARRGSYAQGRYVHTSDDWWNEAKIEAIGAGFVNDNGFVPQTGIVKTDINLNRRLGEHTVPLGAGSLQLYEFETHLGVHETRTLSDAVTGQPANEIVERKVQPGIWFRSGRQTDLWANLGFDQQRAHRGGKLHDTPALHFGFDSSPLPWMPVLKAEVTLGRQLDVDADRVGGGGNVVVDAGLRFPLPGGWALESDVRVNRAWINGTRVRPAFADNGWRWLGMLHFTASDSLRLLAQNTSSSRRDDGITGLAPWAERGSHRSLLYRHLWRHGRSMSVGYARDRASEANAVNASLTVKFQWEV
ncbi:hypothetical protein IP92_01520 [Pseudoduganella flava]|uniref:Uncharacterized protein n=1 Tax=Pseudoduganella flava TaxID=871742 RepID=A0A562Q0S4_9BURK|nr:hypothetical protein [Pseudoduganella flava]QGZ38184.1 hypothetical protein GO485_03385 [Pseudoduganella flava]TWI50291.1 hypothetical protein IP92_01520 [Pseudoduganella flava]